MDMSRLSPTPYSLAQDYMARQDFPSVNVTAKILGARRDAVSIKARSPSGRVLDLTVEENDYIYTARFTPTEVGKWRVSILYNGKHIKDSPYNMSVYNRNASQDIQAQRPQPPEQRPRKFPNQYY